MTAARSHHRNLNGLVCRHKYGMNLRRETSRAAARFHEHWVTFLRGSTPQTLKRVAHELKTLEEMNAGYYDGVIFSRLLRNLEYVIGQVTHSNWTVARSRNDLRGRTRGKRHNSRDRVRIDHKVRQALREWVSPLTSIADQ